jgi:hypothetical protein
LSPLPPQYFGIFDNAGRLMVLMNYNHDVGDGWELPEDLADFSKTSFKLGINFLIYVYTH